MTEAALKPLTDEEKDALSPTAPAEERDAISWRHRLVSEVTLVDLNWQGTKWEASTLSGVRFVDCKFTSASFLRCRLLDCTFVRCSFLDGRFDRTELLRTCFDACQLDELYWRAGTVTGVELNDSELTGARIEELSGALRLQGGRLEESRLSGGRLSELRFEGMRLHAVRLTEVRADACAFIRCHLEQVDLLGGTIAHLQVEGGTLMGAKWADLSCHTLALLAATEVESLYLNSCQVLGLSLRDCEHVNDLYIFKCQIQTLLAERCYLSGWLTESALHPGSRIADCTLDYFFLDGSHLSGLTLEQVVLRGGLSVRGAHFSGLRLRAMTVADGFDRAVDGAIFESSDTFQELFR